VTTSRSGRSGSASPAGRPRRSRFTIATTDRDGNRLDGNVEIAGAARAGLCGLGSWAGGAHVLRLRQAPCWSGPSATRTRSAVALPAACSTAGLANVYWMNTRPGPTWAGIGAGVAFRPALNPIGGPPKIFEILYSPTRAARESLPRSRCRHGNPGQRPSSSPYASYGAAYCRGPRESVQLLYRLRRGLHAERRLWAIHRASMCSVRRWARSDGRPMRPNGQVEFPPHASSACRSGTRWLRINQPG